MFTNDYAPVGRGARGLRHQVLQQENQPSSRTARRRRPPYGARLAAVLARPETWPGRPGTSADGGHVTIWVLAGADAWDTARDYAVTGAMYVMAPPGEDPAGYDWRVVAGHPPVLIRPCGEVTAPELSAVAAAMIRDGAERVLVLRGSGRRYRGGRPS